MNKVSNYPPSENILKMRDLLNNLYVVEEDERVNENKKNIVEIKKICAKSKNELAEVNNLTEAIIISNSVLSMISTLLDKIKLK
jgi:hypothetical protein